MADKNFQINFEANENVVSVLSKIGRNIEKLANNFSDLSGMLQDMSKKAKTSTDETAKAVETMASSVDASSKKASGSVKKAANEMAESVTTLKKAIGSNDGLDVFKLKKSDIASGSAADIAKLTSILESYGTTLSRLTKDPNNAIQQTIFSLVTAGQKLATFNTELKKSVQATKDLLAPSMGTPLTAGEKNLTNFEGIRASALAGIRAVEELKAQINALSPAARAGSKEAQNEIVKLTVDYTKAAAAVGKYNDQIASANSEFKKLTQFQNQRLEFMRYRQITMNDIFPTQEQQKLQAIQQQVNKAVADSVAQGAVKDTLNMFIKSGAQVKNVDENIVRLAEHLPRVRYALYDVSNSVGLVSASLLAVPVAIAAVAASFERDFASVIRTTEINVDTQSGQDAVKALKNEFVALSQEIPVSFKDLTKIGELAGQLNIPAANMAKFTETVAKFAATTDVTINEAATAFGRLDQLIEGVNGQYDRLGSSIAKVGINSVATESQIIRIAQQISSIANLAGFSADEVIGFSAALASVGTTPELARGTFTRLFTQINGAISGTNSYLDDFARLSGMTAEQFASSWESGKGVYNIVDMLAGLDAEGAKAEQTLRNLNIVSVRDVPLMLKLAQNYKGVAEQLGIAAQGWQENTELERQYSIITSTVSEKVAILQGNLQALFNTIGAGTPAIGVFVDGLIYMVKAIKSLLDNPLTGFITTAILALTAFGAVGGIILSLLLRMIGNFAGIATVSIEMRKAIGQSNVAFGGLGTSMLKAALSGTLLQGTLTALQKTGHITAETNDTLSQSLEKKKEKAREASVGLGQLSKMTVMATAATRIFAQAINGLVVGTAITLGFTAIAGGAALIGEAMKSTEQKNKEAAEKMFGTSTALAEAMKKDAQSISATTIKIPVSIEETDASTVSQYADNIYYAIDAQGNLEKAVRGTTGAINQQSAAYDVNAKTALAGLLEQSEDFQKIIADTGAINKLGGDRKAFIKAILGDPVNGAKEYIDSLVAALDQSKGTIDVQGILQQTQWDSGLSQTDVIALSAALGLNAEEAYGVYDAYNALSTATISITGEIEQSSIAATTGSVTQEALADSLLETGDSADAAASDFDSFKTSFNDAFGDIDALKQMNDDMDTLLSGIQQNGTAFDTMSSGGINNLTNLRAALYSSIQAAEAQGITAVDAIALVFAQLQAQGIDTAVLLQQVAIMGYNVADVQSAISRIPTDTFKKMSVSAGGAAEKIRTLSDYANDLATVFSRAFDIRFSGQETLDDIREGWRDMADGIAEATQEIDDLNISIGELTADRALKEYFLSVAEAYGDTIRAAELRAELAKIDAELTKKNKDLAKATNGTNKSLVGNSEAAAGNRAEILSLVKSYQDHIKALASSGMSQEDLALTTEQLRQDFLTQATALGYNSSELEIYASAFDDVSAAIANVPRDVTVDFNGNPALTAINEFVARANSALRGVGSGMADAYNQQIAKMARGDVIRAEIARLQSLITSDRTEMAYGPRMRQLTAILNSNNYADGGYTGAGGKYQIAGVVHKGEYVVPQSQVNQNTGLPYFMGQSRSFAGGGFASSAQSQMVYLSPEDRSLLRGIGGSGEVVLYANNEAIARSANAGNRQIVAAGGRP